MSDDARDLGYLKTATKFYPVESCPWCKSEDLAHLATRADGLPVSRCNDCHLGFLAELPEDLAVFYDADYYVRSPIPGTAPAVSGYEDYERSFSPSSFRWLSMMLRAIGGGGQRLFDLGAATGTFLEIAAYDGFECHGSELTAEGASAAQRKGLHVEPGFFDINDWERGSFDVVTALEVLEHVKDLPGVLEDLAELMTDDGLLVFFVPNVTDSIIATYGDQALDFNKSFDHTIFFNPAALERICADAFGPDSLTLFTADVEQFGQRVSAALGFVRKSATVAQPERQLLDVLDGNADVTALDSAEAALAIALAAGKFFRYELAEAALKRAATLGAADSDINLSIAQIRRNQGRLFEAMSAIEELAPLGLPNSDALAGPLLNEVVADFLTMLGIEVRGLSGGLREVHSRLDRAIELQRVLDETQSRADELAGENTELFRMHRATTAELERSERALVEERAEVAKLISATQDHLQQLIEQLDREHETTNRLNYELGTATEALNNLRSEKSAAVRRANSAQERNKELSAKLNTIQRSRAWRAIQKYRRFRNRLRFRRKPAATRPVAVTTAATVAATDKPERPDAPAPVLTEYPATVSVIMPVYNKGETLAASVESVLNQTLGAVEVVIWNDGSTEAATLEALETVAEHDRITVFHGENQGVIGARNSAMSFARGEFITCLDPDDFLAPTYLEKAVALMRAHPDVAIAYPWQRTVGDKTEIWKTENLNPRVIGRANQAPVCSVFRREVFTATGGFSPEMRGGFEDWEFWAHAAELGFKGRVIPEPLFDYTWLADTNESRDAGARLQFDKLRGRIQNLHPRLEQVPIPSDAAEPPPASLRLAPPQLPQGEGRPVLLFMPWFTVGGADRMIESLIRRWTADRRTVVAVTTLDLGPGMHDRSADLLDLTPYAYRLPSILPRELWREFVDRLLSALPPTTVLNVGSTWLHENAAAIQAQHPEVRIVDQQFNTSGHLAGNINAGDAIDATVVAYRGLERGFVTAGRAADSIHTVFVGIDPPSPTEPDAAEKLRKEIGVAADRRFVVFIGRLSEEKRPEWLLPLGKALAGIDTDLVVVGSGPLADKLEPEFSEIEGIHWVERVDDVGPLYAAAAAVVLSSKIEGIPLTLMEGLAHSTPVVATAVGGIPELEGTPGLRIVSADDRDEWIRAVIDTIESDDIKAELPDWLTVDNMAREYAKLIDD